MTDPEAVRNALSFMEWHLGQALATTNRPETEYLRPELEELLVRVHELRGKLNFNATLQRDHAALHDDPPTEGIGEWISGRTTGRM